MIKNQAGDRLYAQIKGRLNEAYNTIHTSGNTIDGYFSRSVQEKLKKITGRKHAKLLTSGTTAIMTALMAWDIIKKRVACVNYSFIASANQASLLNDVEFFDINDKGVMVLDEQFDHDAVIPVSLYGNTIDYDNLKVATSTKVIVDCAQGIGSSYKGKPDGSFGDAAIFSFAGNKPIPTAGTHGALLWDDDQMSDRVEAASRNGKLSRDTGIVSYGTNGTPYELQAAQIDIGLDYLQQWQSKRKNIHQYYTDKFRNLPFEIIHPADYCESNYHKFSILSKDRNKLINFLADNGVQATLQYTDNFADFFGSEKQFPNTDRFCKNIIVLPNHAWLTDAEIEKVATTVNHFYKINQ